MTALLLEQKVLLPGLSTRMYVFATPRSSSEADMADMAKRSRRDGGNEGTPSLLIRSLGSG